MHECPRARIGRQRAPAGVGVTPTNGHLWVTRVYMQRQQSHTCSVESQRGCIDIVRVHCHTQVSDMTLVQLIYRFYEEGGQPPSTARWTDRPTGHERMDRAHANRFKLLDSSFRRLVALPPFYVVDFVNSYQIQDCRCQSAHAIPKQKPELPYSFALMSRGHRPMWFRGALAISNSLALKRHDRSEFQTN